MIRSLQSLNAASDFLDAPGPSSAGGSLSQLLFEAAEVVDPSENLGQQIGRPTQSSPDSSARDPTRRGLIKNPPASHALLRSSEEFGFGNANDAIPSSPGHPPDPGPTSASLRLSVLPSLRLPIIPRSFHAPLSFSCPENFQVAGETSADDEMSLYAFPLLLLWND